MFICHASEDKETVAKPLAEALQRVGLRVWYDDLVLMIGDSIRRSIDEGLRKSQYGLVILSHNFFRKEWPQKELDALLARERNGIKVILPIWHQITHEEVAKHSPLLADRYALSTSRGLQFVAQKIKELIKPGELKEKSLVLIGTINVLSHEVTVDGELVANDVYAYVEGERTYFPARYAALALGVNPEDIYWDKATNMLTLIKSVAGGVRVVQLQAGSPFMVVNGIKIAMDSAPFLAGQELMVSVSYLAPALGGGVTFDASTFTAIFTSYRSTTAVEEWSLAVGRRLGLSARQLADLALLARAHDIGKVAVPCAVLLKPGPLTKEEAETLKSHCENGYRIALSSPELAGIADLILKHHERWDGNGYPLGLKGEEIPVECRILAVAEAFDAMTLPRPYRKPLSFEEAAEELRRVAGKQFDPRVVEVFLSEVLKLPEAGV